MVFIMPDGVCIGRDIPGQRLPSVSGSLCLPATFTSHLPIFLQILLPKHWFGHCAYEQRQKHIYTHPHTRAHTYIHWYWVYSLYVGGKMHPFESLLMEATHYMLCAFSISLFLYLPILKHGTVICSPLQKLLLLWVMKVRSLPTFTRCWTLLW